MCFKLSSISQETSSHLLVSSIGMTSSSSRFTLRLLMLNLDFWVKSGLFFCVKCDLTLSGVWTYASPKWPACAEEETTRRHSQCRVYRSKCDPVWKGHRCAKGSSFLSFHIYGGATREEVWTSEGNGARFFKWQAQRFRAETRAWFFTILKPPFIYCMWLFCNVSNLAGLFPLFSVLSQDIYFYFTVTWCVDLPISTVRSNWSQLSMFLECRKRQRPDRVWVALQRWPPWDGEQLPKSKGSRSEGVRRASRLRSFQPSG